MHKGRNLLSAGSGAMLMRQPSGSLARCANRQRYVCCHAGPKCFAALSSCLCIKGIALTNCYAIGAQHNSQHPSYMDQLGRMQQLEGGAGLFLLGGVWKHSSALCQEHVPTSVPCGVQACAWGPLTSVAFSLD